MGDATRKKIPRRQAIAREEAVLSIPDSTPSDEMAAAIYADPPLAKPKPALSAVTRDVQQFEACLRDRSNRIFFSMESQRDDAGQVNTMNSEQSKEHMHLLRTVPTASSPSMASASHMSAEGMHLENFHDKENVPPARGAKPAQPLVNTALTLEPTRAAKPVGLLANIAARKAGVSSCHLPR